MHALEPLLYAFRPEQILMLSEPTVCMGALWIPYRRDTRLMKSILAAGAAHPEVSMVYCHADVRGAMMNDGMRSREGLDIDMFPPNLPIYSGHFHKPHTVIIQIFVHHNCRHFSQLKLLLAVLAPQMTKNLSTLRYVGSPYQTSLSEAGQDKFLYCMSVAKVADSSGNSRLVWSEESRWTIDIGKKYIKAADAQDPSVHAARAGDRVVIPVRVGEDYEAEALGAKLRDRGVEVELRHERNAMPSRPGATADPDGSTASITGDAGGVASTLSEDRDPVRQFADYMGTIDLSALTESPASPVKRPTSNGGTGKEILTDVARLALHSAVLEEGKATIERLTSSEALAGNELGDSVRHSGRLFDLKLGRLRLKDFGPYGGSPVDYPLSGRGLVLIRGQSTDGTGADSNGSGKVVVVILCRSVASFDGCVYSLYLMRRPLWQ